MRLRNIPGSKEMIDSSEYVIQNPSDQKGKWHEIFGNQHPIHLEIGMGKGCFLTVLAEQNPDINYLGIEKYSSVLVRAVEKRAEHPEIHNLYFLCYDAELICSLFAPGEIERIYLNFSDPWPKDRHAKRRLTSREYLTRYSTILTSDGYIEFKTDNRSLFEFSLEQIREAGWEAKNVTYDLHNSSDAANNIMTEYEERFSSIGNPILRLTAHQK